MTRQTIHTELLKRLKEKRRFVQVLAGPRQVGKTTVVRQVMEAAKIPAHYASADEPSLRDRTWLEQQWDMARLKAREGKTGALLVLDEIQKVTDWSSKVKLLWDADTHSGVPLKVILLGSSPLLIQSGLTESLAGRFEVIPAPHWSFTEMREAFGWTLEQYFFYGAYPGAAELIDAVLSKVRTGPSTAACIVSGCQRWPTLVSTVDQRGWVCTTAFTSGRAR